jgi:bifunctional non-homologous end joining protein LigD
MVVGGWAPGRAGNVGSLLVGGHDEAGALVYCGHVGFGLSTQMRRTLAAKFVELSCAASPFTGPQIAGARWLTPSVVVNVDNREFNGRLRHPSLKGLADVEPRSVVLPYS